MRVKMRQVLDTDQPINLRRLKPLDKIKAGLIIQWKQTNIYKRNKQQREEAVYLEQLRKDEDVKNYILALLYRELISNVTLQQKDKECESVVISISQHYEDSLYRLFPNLFGRSGEMNKDFLSYEITRVEEHADIRKAFKEMPYLFRCSKKHL